MVVLTIIFLVMSVVGLFKGRLFNDFLVQITEENIKMNTIENYKFDGGLLVKTLVFLLYSIVLLLIQVIYLSNALDYDMYKYPTLIMLFLIAFSFVKTLVTSKKKEIVYDEQTIYKARENANKKFTVKTVTRNLLNVSYYTYILYLLVF